MSYQQYKEKEKLAPTINVSWSYADQSTLNINGEPILKINNHPNFNRDSIKAMLYMIYEQQKNIDNLNDKLESLNDKIDKLTNEILYAPGGIEYNKAKKHFENL